MTREEIATEIAKGLEATVHEQPGKEKLYAEWLEDITTLDNPRCVIYAGMWCTFSQLLVANFLLKAEEYGKNLRSLREVYSLFADEFASFILLDERKAEFTDRARSFLNYVGDLDLSKYGVPEYDKAEEWI